MLSYGQYLAMEMSNMAYNHLPVNQSNTPPPSADQVEVVHPMNYGSHDMVSHTFYRKLTV